MSPGGANPKTEKAGRGKAVFWALVALLALGASAWWLSREPAEKEALRAETADRVNDLLKETPLAGMGDILRVSPPPPPDIVLHPPTEPGTLSGRHVEGAILAPAQNGEAPELSLAQGGARGDEPTPATPSANGEQGDKPAFSPEPIPPVKEDAKLKQTYLRQLADWLADKYRPGPRGGSLAVSAQSLNSLFGVTIADKTGSGRESLLRYAMQPSMVRGLYSLYINQFMTDLNEAAGAKGFNAEANREFHRALGGHAALLASALAGALETPDLSQKLAAVDELAQNAVDINAQLANATFELDEAREAKAQAHRLEAIQLRVNGLAARYRRAMDEHERARATLAAEIRTNSGQPLDEEAALYVAAWARRRLAAGGDARGALDACVAVMRDLARRCDEVAK